MATFLDDNDVPYNVERDPDGDLVKAYALPGKDERGRANKFFVPFGQGDEMRAESLLKRLPVDTRRPLDPRNPADFPEFRRRALQDRGVEIEKRAKAGEASADEAEWLAAMDILVDNLWRMGEGD